MNLSDYDFDLPKELIADRPRRPRGTSKLLVIEKKTGKIKATTFNRINRSKRIDKIIIAKILLWPVLFFRFWGN